jgi:hypothetical protein
MHFINSTQSYSRPVSTFNFRQLLNLKGLQEVPGGITLWKTVGKAGLAALAVTFLATTIISWRIGAADETIAKMETFHGKLKVQQAYLTDYQKELWGKDSIASLAQEKFDLYIPIEGQVKHLR